LNAIHPELENQRIREWRVRAAIRDHDWPATLATIGWLSDEEQASARWQYWRARALDELGFSEDALLIYQQLVTERNYHGFLAADRLQLPYSFENQPASVSQTDMEIVASLPGVRRAKELLELDRLIEARREWEFTSERLNEEQLLIAAKLAESWQWHSSAIFTADRIEYWDDIPLRFPLGYQNDVIYQANKFDIEPAWIYGIMRQESAFVSDARSSQGALGLMQLLPSTGKYIARRNKTPYSGSYDLLVADKNIKLGSAYLKDVRDRLFDHPVLATAAYNAGYAKVKRWLPNDAAMEADIWIETIPYDETRDYLERVLAYTAIYDWRLNPGRQNTLVNFMKPVSKPGTVATAKSGSSS
jgi:soluble lytic murein transglycosylase